MASCRSFCRQLWGAGTAAAAAAVAVVVVASVATAPTPAGAHKHPPVGSVLITGGALHPPLGVHAAVGGAHVTLGLSLGSPLTTIPAAGCESCPPPPAGGGTSSNSHRYDPNHPSFSGGGGTPVSCAGCPTGTCGETRRGCQFSMPMAAAGDAAVVGATAATAAGAAAAIPPGGWTMTGTLYTDAVAIGGAVVPSLTLGAVLGVTPTAAAGKWGGSLGLGLPDVPTLGTGGVAPPPASAAAETAAGRVRPFWEAVGADGDAPSFSVCLGDDAPGGDEPVDVEYEASAATSPSPLPAAGSGGVLSFGVHPVGSFVPLSQRPWTVHRTAPHTAWVVDANAELTVGSTSLLLTDLRRLAVSYTHADTRVGASIHASLAKALSQAAAGAAAGGAAAPFNATFITKGGCAMLDAAEVAALPDLDLSLAGVQEHPRDGEEPPGVEVDESPPPPRAEVRLRLTPDQYAPAVSVNGRVYRCGALGVLPTPPANAEGGEGEDPAAPDAVPPDVVLGTAALRHWTVTFVAPAAGGVEGGGIAFARHEPSGRAGCPFPGALTPRPGAPGAAAAGAATTATAASEGAPPPAGGPLRRVTKWRRVMIGVGMATTAAAVAVAVIGCAARWRVAAAVARADAATASAPPAVATGGSAWMGDDEEEQALVMHVKE